MPLQSHLTSYQQADLHCTKSYASHRGPHNRDIRVLVTDILSSSSKGGHSSPTNVRYRGILFCAPIVDKRNKHLIALSADAMLGWSDWGPSLFERRGREGEVCRITSLPVRQPNDCRPSKRHVWGDEGKAVGTNPPTALLSVALRQRSQGILTAS